MINNQTIAILGALLISGLNAGFYYAWQVSVIQGNKLVSDFTYLESMQNINRAILNPAFFTIFLGGLLSLSYTAFLMIKSPLGFSWSLAALITYLIGVLGVTILGNVPLNEMLDSQGLEKLNASSLQSLRVRFEQKWNLFHLTRTAFALLSFVFLMLSAFHYFKD